MKATAKPEPTEREVVEYLRRHPDLLARHPDLLAVLAPPERPLGGGVADFQQFQLKNLQANTRELADRYNVLVDFCRDHLSVQTQVHNAVLRLVCARGLASLLEVLTLDLVSLFDVDVVRLAVEAGAEGTQLSLNEAGEMPHSGIVLISPGTAEAALASRKALLVEDAQARPVPGFDEIFSDCAELARSCALLALDIEQAHTGTRRHGALLAFGVRHAGRFQPGQGMELLTFLARIVAHQLETQLSELAL